MVSPGLLKTAFLGELLIDIPLAAANRFRCFEHFSPELGLGLGAARKALVIVLAEDDVARLVALENVDRPLPQSFINGRNAATFDFMGSDCVFHRAKGLRVTDSGGSGSFSFQRFHLLALLPSVQIHVVAGDVFKFLISPIGPLMDQPLQDRGQMP